MVKLLLTSDLHGDLNGIRQLVRLAPKYDLVLVAGDLIDRYTTIKKSFWIIDTVRVLKNLVLVHGNNESEEVLNEYRKVFKDRYLNFSSVEMNGFQTIGLGGAIPKGSSRHYPKWGSNLQKIDISNNLPKIVISHYPARGINDVVSAGFHIGFIEINRFIGKVRPILLLTGHVHEAVGISEVKLFGNEGKAKEKFRYKSENFEFKIKNGSFLAINPAYIGLRRFVHLSILRDKIYGRLID